MHFIKPPAFIHVAIISVTVSREQVGNLAQWCPVHIGRVTIATGATVSRESQDHRMEPTSPCQVWRQMSIHPRLTSTMGPWCIGGRHLPSLRCPPSQSFALTFASWPLDASTFSRPSTTRSSMSFTAPDSQVSWNAGQN